MKVQFKSTDVAANIWLNQIGSVVRDDFKTLNLPAVARNEVNDHFLEVLETNRQRIEALQSAYSREREESKRRAEETQKQFLMLSEGLTRIEGKLEDMTRAQKVSSPRKRGAIEEVASETTAMELDDCVPAPVSSSSSTMSDARSVEAWKAVGLKHNEVDDKAKITIKKALMHQVFKQYYEYHMHKSTPLRVAAPDGKNATTQDASRVTMTIELLSAVATEDQKAQLALNDPADLAALALELQNAFQTRLVNAEKALLGKEVNGKLTLPAVEERIANLKKIKPDIKDVFLKKKDLNSLY